MSSCSFKGEIQDQKHPAEPFTFPSDYGLNSCLLDASRSSISSSSKVTNPLYLLIGKLNHVYRGILY